MRNTPCECPASGWCERHQCLKSEPLFQLCRRNRAMYRAWEDGHGPCGPPPAEGTVEAGSTEMPGLARRIVNLGTATARYAMSGFHRVSDAECDARLAICVQCPSCEVARMICREKSCGCYLQTKVRWASESCPRGFWPAGLLAKDETLTETTPASD